MSKIVITLLLSCGPSAFAQNEVTLGDLENYGLPLGNSWNSSPYSSYTLTEEDLNNLNNQLSDTFSFSTTEGVDSTIIYNNRGSLTYGMNENGDYVIVETPSNTYRLQAQNLSYSEDGSRYSLFGDQLSLTSDNSDDSVYIDQFSLSKDDEEFQFHLTDIAVQANTSWGAEELTYTNGNEAENFKASNLYIRKENGDYIELGQGSYSSQSNTLQIKSLKVQQSENQFSVDEIAYIEDDDSQQLSTTSLFVTNEAGDYIDIGQANLKYSDDSKTLSLESLSSQYEGKTLQAQSFQASQTGEDYQAAAKGVFIQDELGNFIKIGEADYSSTTSTLNITDLAGQKDGVSLSSDAVSLFSKDGQSLLTGTNIFIADEAGAYVSIGKASFAMDENTQSLSLTSINAVKDGYTLTSDKISYSTQGDTQQIGITNGRATGQDLNLSFSGVDITNSGDRLSVSTRDFSYSDSSMGYRTDRLDYSSNGDSFDINTRGILSVSGTDLDVVANARGINNISQGINETTDSEGNKRIDGHFAIGTTDEGGIKELGIALGDTISFSAKDADGNATELSANFSYDEKTKTFYLKTVFKNGDKTEIKVMPFTFESEKVGEDAVAALSIKLNEQNIEEYLDTVTSIIDFHEVNKHLAIGRGGMRVRLGGGFGTEFTFTETNGVFDSRINADDPNYSLGLGLFSRGEHSTQSVGVLMSSDSNLSYNIHNGKLSVAGIELPDYGEIPLTIGAYYSYQNDEGTAVFATLGTSLAEFEDLPITAGVGIKWEDENKSFRVGVVADSHGDYAAGINFQYRFGGSVNNSLRRRFNNYDSYDNDNYRDISSYSSIHDR